MVRRELLGAVGAAAGLAAVWSLEARADDGPGHHHMDKVHEDCLRACGECARTCNMMAHHCMQKIVAGDGPVQRHARSQTLAMDCQDFCVLSAQMIARSSDLMAFACDACAEACRCCAEECEKAQDDPMMADCARKCRECERTCRAMVRSMKKDTKVSTR
jgi:hypothetical protein